MCMFSLISFCLLLNFEVIVAWKQNTRIVGGSNTNIENYPYQVSLLYLITQPICGGALISSYYVLTAAHCTEGTQPSDLIVRYGTSISDDGGQVVPVAQIIQHPQYSRATLDYDIAVLRFDFYFVFGRSALPIRLCSAVVPNGALTVITGWGDTIDGQTSAPARLQVANLPRISQQSCRNIYGAQVTDRMLCAGSNQGGVGICVGDSGGPLAYNGELCGIASWGVGCGKPNRPSGFADIFVLKSFILGVTGTL